jgi:2-oxoglutarate decarboxylase
VYRAPRSPLIVITPKSLLRAHESRSPLAELSRGSFAEVIEDPAVPAPDRVQRIVLCSGKIAHEAMRRRDQLVAGTADPVRPLSGDNPGATVDPQAVAIVRVEQLYPWPEEAIAQVLGRYGAATEVVWLQEEPENMGAWSFVHARLHRLLRDHYALRHVSRQESASPATGSAALHQVEQADLLVRSVG